MNKKILNIAIPNIISNITIPLLGIVDISLVGHLESEVYIGAIAIGSMIFNFIYWGFSFLRMGTSGFTAQTFGKRDIPECFINLHRALFVGLIGAILLLLLQKPIGIFSFYILNGSEDVEFFAKQYFYIRIWAAPATIGLYSIHGWFIGMQNAKVPMAISITINVLNIFFNVLFVKVFGMKSDGVALGTVLAQYSGLILGMFFILRHRKRFFNYFHFKSIIDSNALKEFFNVNKDIFIRTVSLIFALSFFTAKSATYGDTLLAVNTLLFQFFTIFAYVADGFAYAGEALAGKFYGAKNFHKLMDVTRRLFVWGGALAIIFTLIYMLLGNNLVQLFTDIQETITESKHYIYWTFLIPLTTFAAFIWDGIFIGVTASKAMRNAMLISTFLIYLPSYYLFHHLWGNHGLWASFILLMIARAMTMTLMAKKAVLIRN